MSTIIVVLLLASPAHAQGPAGYVIPSVPAPRDPLPRFTIAPRGAPLGAVGLPLPPIGLQPSPLLDAPVRRLHQPAVFGWPMVFYVAAPAFVSPPTSEPAAKPADIPPPPGRLILDVAPTEAQVFADGYYVGMPGDFSPERGGGVLDAGPHRLDVSAAGYEPIAVDIRVVSGQTLTYRATLKALPPPTAIPPSTFYLIPGCYMGNIPPKDAHLPKTCDQSRAVIWRP